MKQYDSIEYYGDNWGIPIIAFDKLDGSNIRLLFQFFMLCIPKGNPCLKQKRLKSS